jgi:choline dehydrogenase-like flavoprotein
MAYRNFRDGRKIHVGADIESDLCIVGTGAAGITIAREFANSTVRVCLLEAGGLSVEPGVDRLSEIESVGNPYWANHGDVNANRLRLFGGATNHWGGHCAPLERDDFEKQSWIAYSGWPYGYDELCPYYSRAHDVLGLGEFNYDSNAIGSDLRLQEFPFNASRVVTTVSRYNPVRFGLRFGDQLDEATNVQVILYADVSAVQMKEVTGDEVASVSVRTIAGNQFSVRARYFVIACGGIENARVLLISNRQRATGLGNHSDLVGRFFQEHLWYPSGYILPRAGNLGLRYYLSELPFRNVRVRAHLALPSAVVRELQIPKFRAEVLTVSAAHQAAGAIRRKISFEDVVALISDPVGVGTVMRCKSEAAPTAYQLGNNVQQVPNPDSRVKLSTKKDQFDRPQPQLDWRLSQLDQEGVTKAQRLVAQEVGRSGFGRMRIEMSEGSDDFLKGCLGGGHHMGTTRMDDDPARGVADGSAKVHHTYNLYLAGSSLFPTGGWANPTLTIVATSIRLADHLKSRFKADRLL